MALTTTTVAYSGTNTASTLYQSSNTLTAQVGNAITTMILCNTSASIDTYVTLYAVPSASGLGLALGTASTSNMIVNNLKVPAGETVSFDQEKLVLGAYDSIQGYTSVSPSTLAITISTIPV